jgi:hypothetical protein
LCVKDVPGRIFASTRFGVYFFCAVCSDNFSVSMFFGVIFFV